jgi:zinc protease
VLGASAKSRLLDRLRQKEGLSYGAGSFLVADSQDTDGLFAGMAIAAPQNASKAEASLYDEFRRLISEGIPTEELEDAKASFALQTKGQLSNDGAVAGMLNEGLYLGRTMEYYEKLYRAIDALTSDQVNKALKKYIDPTKMVRVQAGDLEGGS